MKNNKNGFTLFELLIVLVIIGLLVSYVGPQYFGQLGKSEVKISRTQVYELKKALNLYRLDTGHYPHQKLGLKALIFRPSNETKWRGPYLQKQIPTDPWGGPYFYQNPGRQGLVDVFSLGRDKRVGGTNDNADIYG